MEFMGLDFRLCKDKISIFGQDERSKYVRWGQELGTKLNYEQNKTTNWH